MTPRLTLQGLTMRFGGLTVLDGVDLAVAPGERVALVGPNGSGKSTLFNIVTGAVAATAGRVMLDGVDITSAPPHGIAAAGVIRSFQTPRVFKRLSVRDNIRPTTGPADDAAIEGLIDIGGLAGRVDDLAGDLGIAELRRLELVRAFAARPSLLLLDEPTAGLSPSEADGVMALLKAHLPPNTAVVVIEHRLDLVTAFADRAIVLHDGKIIADGAPDIVRRIAPVLEAYLGRAA
jgi:ABC-type branched-subunit amino acid transport system ATPase component